MSTITLDSRRAGRLLWVAIKYGAGPLARRVLRLSPHGPAYTVGVRLALEELGLTFVKLGQFLAMRFDILPLELCQELSRLFEAVPPMDVSRVTAVIEAELGGPVSLHFAYFAQQPLAAASVAQVHEARTHQGQRVAVKVQRPDIAAVFEADMRNLRRAASWLDRIDVVAALSLTDVADEFATYTRRELDFRMEGATADRVRDRLSKHAVAPKVLWHLSSAKVLTMEFLTGMSIAKLSQRLRRGGPEQVKAELPQLDLHLALHNFAFAALSQLFQTGVFHADPHPGNILIRDDNRVAFVDFGIFGRLSNRTRETLASYIENVAAGNLDEAFRHYSSLSVPTADTDVASFQRETKAVLSRWYEASKRADSPVHSRHLGMIVGEMLQILHRHRLRMGMDTMLFWRAVIALDSSALSLSDRFDLLGEMQAFFKQYRRGVVRRAWDVMADSNWLNEVIQVAATSVQHVGDSLGAASQGRATSIPTLSEAPVTRRQHNRDAKAVAMALGLTASLIAAATLPVDRSLIWLALLGAAGAAQTWVWRAEVTGD